MYETNVCKNQGNRCRKASGFVCRAFSGKENVDSHRAGCPVCSRKFLSDFRAIYDIGREDVQRDIIEIAPLDIPDIVPADTLPDKRVQEMEEFLTDSIRKKMSNDINKLKQRLEIRKYLVLPGCSFSSSVRCGSFSHRPKRTNKRRRKMRASTPNCLTREEPT